MSPHAPQSNVNGWDLLPEATHGSLLRISTAGSVDDGKSTLIGRLLHDTGNIYDDHIAALRRKSTGQKTLALALVTDGLRAEQEQGITIDVAYRYFSTPRRRFILADTPGHEQYTRNMATGASTANLTLLLVDARKGVLQQTRRHAFIAALLGVPRLLVAVNKMDLVDFSVEVFDRIREEFSAFAARLGVREVKFVPVSALEGDNIVERSERMPWYHGETILEYLESVYIAGDQNQIDLRFPVQYVIRPHQNYRGYAGQISSGVVRVGEEVVVLPSMRRSRVRSIDVDARTPALRTRESAAAPMSVVITLADEIDISRGDMIVRPMNVPLVRNQFEAMVVWMDDEPMDPSRPYLVLHTSRQVRATVDAVTWRIDVNTLSRLPGQPLTLNEVGRISLTTTQPLFLDAYQKNRSTGNFILIDPGTARTVAAGMVLDRSMDETARGETHQRMKATNLHSEGSLVAREEREARLGQRGVTIWCTGLSGSGKSSIVRLLERRLFDAGALPFRLDGDNLRGGLNSNLSFSAADRGENIRRAAEVARLMNDAGVVVLCSFISPLAADRQRAREIIGSEHFIEVYLATPLEVCEARDPHGLYARARRGEIPEFTGVSSPYEPPVKPDISLPSGSRSIEECVEALWQLLLTRQVLSPR